MTGGKSPDRHSDHGPSIKDWEPDSAGGDENLAPEKDLRSQAHRAERNVQSGTAQKGKRRRSHRPSPKNKQEQLDEALKDSFPASDPPSAAQPGVTGWDIEDEAVEKVGGKR